MPSEPRSYNIDPDAFARSQYDAVSDLIELGSPSHTIELIPGRPETLTRMWAMPGGGTELGVLEPIFQLLSSELDDAAFAAALQPVLDAWQPVYEQLQDQFEDTVSIGRDGQALKLDFGF